MCQKYLIVTNKIKTTNIVELDEDFVKCRCNKYIKIESIKVFNDNGQIDIGCCLCGTFADDSIKSSGLINDFIASTYNPEPKIIAIHNNDKRLMFYFRDYKGELLDEKLNYYYTIELLLLSSDKEIVLPIAENQ